jgi:hypothetical protein
MMSVRIFSFIYTFFSGSSTTLTDSQAPVLTQMASTGTEAGDTTQKAKEKIVSEKKEPNNVAEDGSTSEIQVCRDWKRGKCARGAKCRYKHDSLQVRASMSWIQQLNVDGNLHSFRSSKSK